MSIENAWRPDLFQPDTAQRRMELGQEVFEALEHVATFNDEADPTGFAEAQERAMHAIHRLCDQEGVGVDTDGSSMRFEYAAVLDSVMRHKERGTGLVWELMQLSVPQVVEWAKWHGINIGKAGPEDRKWFDASYVRAYQEQTRARRLPRSRDRGAFDAEPESPSQSANTSEQGRRRGKPTEQQGGVGRQERRAANESKFRTALRVGRTLLAAIGVGVISPLLLTGSASVAAPSPEKTKGVADTEEQASVHETTTTTASTTTTLPPATMTVPETAVDTRQPITPADLPAPPLPPAPQAIEIVTVEKGSNCWNKLQKFAVGTSGSAADENDALNRVIGEVLPVVSQANGGIDLGKISAGFRLVIPADTAARLKAFRP